MVERGGFGLYTENFRCYQCGKQGYKNGTWSYKRQVSDKIAGTVRKVFFCSYGCMRAFDAGIEAARKAKEEMKEAKKAKHDKA